MIDEKNRYKSYINNKVINLNMYLESLLSKINIVVQYVKKGAINLVKSAKKSVTLVILFESNNKP